MLDLTRHPSKITVDTSADFNDVCELERRGDLYIRAINVGERNCQWIFDVVWKEIVEPLQPQLL